MIKPNELRIGNLVQCDIWENNNISILKVNSITSLSIHCENYSGSFGGLEGIPIDSKKLIDFGFELVGEDRFKINIGKGLNTIRPSKLIIKFTKNFNWVVIQPANRTIYLKSIHQLQNLYFALTGKELEIINSLKTREKICQ